MNNQIFGKFKYDSFIHVFDNSYLKDGYLFYKLYTNFTERYYIKIIKPWKLEKYGFKPEDIKEDIRINKTVMMIHPDRFMNVNDRGLQNFYYIGFGSPNDIYKELHNIHYETL